MRLGRWKEKGGGAPSGGTRCAGNLCTTGGQHFHLARAPQMPQTIPARPKAYKGEGPKAKKAIYIYILYGTSSQTVLGHRRMKAAVVYTYYTLYIWFHSLKTIQQWTRYTSEDLCSLIQDIQAHFLSQPLLFPFVSFFPQIHPYAYDKSTLEDE